MPPLALAPLWQAEPQRAEALARAYGRCTGREAQIIGLNWVLAPVCDVNNNPANPVINVRAWGKQLPQQQPLAVLFCRG
ncbi:glycoside hydrolase family 3 N-terminal domain-containing protein [Synechococcus lacustris Tous-12m]